MSSLDDKINKFLKSKQFQDKFNKEIKTNKNFGGTKEIAEQYGKELRDILSANVHDINGIYTPSFLDYVEFNVEFISGVGWVANVGFDEDKVVRDSLYPEEYPIGAYLPYIYNNGMDKENSVYGIWHNTPIKSNPKRKAYHFIQKSVEEFKKRHPNVEINIDEMYEE